MDFHANPLANPNYDASIDPLINPNNGAYLAGHFNADPQFPAAPAGVVFTEPIANYGDAADYYKDENTDIIYYIENNPEQVLSLEEKLDLNEGDSVIVSPDNEPHYGVNIPSYVKGGFRQRKRAHTYTNEFDQIVETTAFGKMTKK